MEDKNKAIVRRIIDDVWNARRPELIDDLFRKDFILRTREGRLFGPDGYRHFYTLYIKAFPDLKLTIDDLISEGDRVVCLYTATGTHSGQIMDIAPTGKTITTKGVVITRFSEGKMSESWHFHDDLTLMQEIGALPEMEHLLV